MQSVAINLFDRNKRFVSFVGMPGVGKTTLAIAVGHKALESCTDPTTVVYLHLRNIRSASDIPAIIYNEIGLGKDQSDAKKQFIAWIKQMDPSERLLLILDNIDDLLEIDQKAFIDTIHEISIVSKQVSFLFTSRKKFSSPRMDVQSEVVEPLDQTSASKVIQGLSSHVSESNALELAELCGYLPLALKLVGSILHDGIYPADLMISDLKKSRGGKMNTLKDDLFPGETQLEQIIETSYTKLDPESSFALLALGVFPGSFKKSSALEVLSEVVFINEKNKATAFRRIIQNLRTRSLVEYDAASQSFQVHPMVQSFLEHKSKEGEVCAELWCKAEHAFTVYYMELVSSLSSLYWSLNGAKKALDLFNDERMNLEYVLRKPFSETFINKIFSLLENSFLFFRIVLAHDTLIDFLRSCAHQAEEVFGHNSQYHFLFQLLTTTLLGLKGDPRVRPAIKLSLQLLNEYDGPITEIADNHTAVLCTFVGLLYLVQRNFEIAPQYISKSIAWLTEHCPDSAFAGFVHRMIGITGATDPQKTLKHYTIAHDIQQRLIGENPETMILFHNIGSALLRNKDYKGAIDSFASSYRMMINLGMNKHEDTTILLTEMGEAFRCLGQKEESRNCFLESLKVTNYIGLFRSTVWTYKFFARLLRDEAKYNEAFDYLQQALDASFVVFDSGQHNPHVTDIYIDKAAILVFHLGKLHEALQLHLECVLYDKKWNVPVTGKGRHKLLSREQGDYDQALKDVTSKIPSSSGDQEYIQTAFKIATEIQEQQECDQ